MPKTILVIDDEEKITKILSFILSRENFDVKSANNSQNGLRIAQEGEIDLIISDIMMPGMNGYELGEALQKDTSTAEIPFIFLTAKGEVADKFAGYFVGAADYLTKPFKTEELIAKVNRVLGLVSADQLDDGTPANVKARLVETPAAGPAPPSLGPKPGLAPPLPKAATSLSLCDVVETYQCMLIALWADVTDRMNPQVAGDVLTSTIRDLAERYPILSRISVTTSGPVIAGIKQDLETAQIDDINEALTELIATFFERVCKTIALTQEGVKILVFDDSREATEFYSSILAGAGFAIDTSDTSDNILGNVQNGKPDLILISAAIQSADVFETCRMLKGNSETAHVPILMVSDLYDSESIKKSFAFGVSDYIVKPFSDSELVAAVISLVRE